MVQKSHTQWTRVRRLINEVALELGHNNEQRVIDAFVNYPFENSPPWLKRVRLATPAEDQRGIDAVFVTDIGPIGLQLKSSLVGEKKFTRRQLQGQLDPHIVTAIIQPSHTPRDICKIIVPLLRRAREAMP